MRDRLARQTCYCYLWNENPEALRRRSVPQGYCGICQVCGAPGHTRHFPGPVPHTGAWCDECYTQLASRATLGRFVNWIVLLAAFAAGMLVIMRLLFV